jgi:hypothetical protein
VPASVANPVTDIGTGILFVRLCSSSSESHAGVYLFITFTLYACMFIITFIMLIEQ